MAVNVTMPALSPTMTTGTLAKWTIAPGDAVRAGDVIADRVLRQEQGLGNRLVRVPLRHEAEDVLFTTGDG